ncbi:hypothetical protein [Stackebrandtia soli]|uniref:hypothetical protein n=1 Tax=Stackebrandtia soli TaxID=1892856 RepID=UPI0039E8F717
MSVLTPASAPIPSAGGLVFLTVFCLVMTVVLGYGAIALAYTLATDPAAPGVLWIPLTLIGALAILMLYTTVHLPGARRRAAKRYALLDGTTLTVLDGRSRGPRSTELHGTGVAVVSREDYQRRQRFVTFLPRVLTELTGPALAGRGRAALLLCDVPGNGAKATDPPPQRLPDAELAIIAGVLDASPHPDGRRAAADVRALMRH